MKNITIVEVESMGVISQNVIIDHGNDEFTSMPKSVYDAQTPDSQTSVPQSGGTN